MESGKECCGEVMVRGSGRVMRKWDCGGSWGLGERGKCESEELIWFSEERRQKLAWKKLGWSNQRCWTGSNINYVSSERKT